MSGSTIKRNAALLIGSSLFPGAPLLSLTFLGLPQDRLERMAASGEVGKLLQVQNGTPPSTNYNGVDAIHACNILQQLKALYDEAQLTDIVVEVDHGKTFSCHRNVLAAISPYFRSMFTSGLTESSQREVRIVGVESESMHLVLDYAYTSRVTLSESNVQALFTAASIFQIPALQDQCAQFMISRLDPQNCIGVYMFADAYGHQELRERSQDYIRKKFLCVSREQEFLQMTKEQLVSILNNDDLNVEKEEHVYESIVRWLEHDLSGRETHLAEVFSQCIRLPLLDEAFLNRIPAPFACALASHRHQRLPQRLGMTASEMVICFDAAHKHSGKKQTVPCLDTAAGRVFKLCKPPNDLREVGILVSPENDIYIAGGYRPSNSEVSIDHRAESDFWQYEHAARIGCRLVHCCGKLYALGGRVYEGDGRNALKSVECYDARDNCWTAVSPMPVAMEFHSAVEYKDRIYVLQGEYFFYFDPRKDYWSHLPSMCRTFTVEVYDIEKNSWSRKRDLPFDQATSPYIKAMLLQGKLHLFVRATQVMVEKHVFRTSRKNSLYQYDDEADAWTKVYETPDRLWDLGRHFECVVAKLYPQCLQKAELGTGQRAGRTMSAAVEANQANKPLDGGWGWIVVLGAHISIGFAYATPKVLAVFFNYIQDDLLCSFSEFAWIASIMLATMYAGGPISSALVKRYSSRPIVMLGGLMCGMSMVAASFGSSIIYLYLCIGVVGGCGLAFNLNASLTIISKYFLVRRPLANGLAMAGSPVFLCFLAPLIQFFLDRYGWRGSLFILGGLLLNCCVAGALMRPVKSIPQKKPQEQSVVNTSVKDNCVQNMKVFLDLTFFKDRGFVIYLTGNIMFIFGAYAPIVFLPAYAVSHGIDEYKAAYLLSIIGVVDMFVRPGTGLIANIKWIRPRVQYFFSFAMVFNGTCHIWCSLISSYPLLVVYAVLFGVSFGMVFALIFECLMDLMGNERFPSAVGLVTIIECIPMLLGPPAAGFLVDIYGGYKYMYLMCGGFIVTGGMFLFIMNIYHFHMLGKEKSVKRTQNRANPAAPRSKDKQTYQWWS
ncbi:hypothetical protein WMY93_012509 [Mugilogobius chulae]|uniref:Kelch repeat and BTB domain-containing protein 8 n=1 Tax=Mugilogobius chulae TaxID=88201 RepID=A0AAW0PHU3_9GOBI